MSRITTPFTHDSTAAEVVAGVDLTGRRAVVTGGASGIGVETARALAAAGAEVTLAVRNTAAGERVAAEIIASTGNRHVLVAPLELADRASVRAFAAAWDGPLHILVNNAGVMAEPAEPHAGGLGAPVRDQPPRPLRPRARPARRLAAAGAARIVSVSSSAHLRSEVVFDDIHFEHRAVRAVGGVRAVQDGQRALRRRGGQALGRATASSPTPRCRAGSGPHLQRHVSERPEQRKEIGDRFEWKTVEQGASTSVLLAASPLARRRHRPLLRGQQRGAAPDGRRSHARCRGVRPRSGVGHSVVGPLGEAAATHGLIRTPARLRFVWLRAGNLTDRE